MARDFFDGKLHGSPPLLSYIHEHIVCRNYGWTLLEVRSIDYYDFLIHLYVCLAREDADLAHQAEIGGAGRPSGNAAPSKTIQERTNLLKF